MEDNEWSFCSMWTERIREGCADVLINSRLEGDYFFNRSRVSGCQDPYTAADQVAAKIFWRNGLDCYLYDKEGLFENRVFPELDTMHILRLANANATRMMGHKIVVVERSTLSTWVRTFCKAFSVPNWITEVQRIMDANLSNITPILSYKDNMPAGCAVLYSKNGMTGLYCLGTISALRKRGVAASILKKAACLTENLFLQTFGSEQLLSFYEKAGFKAAYAKKIYILRKPSAYSN